RSALPVFLPPEFASQHLHRWPAQVIARNHCLRLRKIVGIRGGRQGLARQQAVNNQPEPERRSCALRPTQLNVLIGVLLRARLPEGHFGMAGGGQQGSASLSFVVVAGAAAPACARRSFAFASICAAKPLSATAP